MEEIPQQTRGKSIKCKAAICRKPGKPLEVEEVEVTPPKSWEVRIKILCASLCHTDLTFWNIPPPMGIYPRILGHEACGIVESVGENVKELKEGDMVLPVLLTDCRECRSCKSKKSNLCFSFPFNNVPGMLRDGRSVFTDSNGEVVHNFINVSGFSQYTVVDVNNVVKIDGGIPPEIACLFSCGASTGIGAAWKVADVEYGSTVAIFGLGSIGLSVAAGARSRGASKIIGVDINPDKFELGKKFGITDFVNPKDCGDKPISEVIKEMTDGGADYCFECVGIASLMIDAFSSSLPGSGKTVILGLEMKGSPLSLNIVDILSGRSISGSILGGTKPRYDIPIYINHYLNKDIHLDELITHEVGLKDINKAFELLVQGKSLRCIIWMDK